MPVFILLSTLSQQGVQTLKSNPERLREVNQDVEELGAKVLHQWATLGAFDFVNIVEAPDVETVAKVSVALGARGSTRIQTLPALEVLRAPSPVTSFIWQNCDASIMISAPENTREGSDLPEERRQALLDRNKPFRERQMSMRVPWVVCEYPVQATAQEAGMTLDE